MLEVHGGLLAWTVITFFILLVVLRAIAWKPILSALDAREKEIKDSLAKAEEAREQADRMAQEYDQMIAKSRREGKEIILASKEAGEKVKTEIITEAKSNAKKILTDNLDQIEREKDKVISEIRQQVVELSVLAAEKIIGKSLEKDDHHKMVQDTIEEYGQT